MPGPKPRKNSGSDDERGRPAGDDQTGGDHDREVLAVAACALLGAALARRRARIP